MKRRDFLKISALGAMSLWVTGCGTFFSDAKEEAGTLPAGSISGGKSMKITIITSSPHTDAESTSWCLAESFMKGAQSAGHEVFRFDAAREETHPCSGCDRCHMDGDCIYDDAIEKTLMPKMLEADMLVLVTPLYYFGMSAQLKTIVDRFYSRTGRLHGKRSALIATAYNSDDWTMTALADHYETLVRYMDWQDVGSILGTGCGARSLVERSRFPEMAYQLGARL